MIVVVMQLRFPRKAYPIPVEGYEDFVSSYGYHPGVEDKHLLKLTKSSVGQSDFCAQQYFIKYPLGVKEPENDNMIRGTNVHDAVEQFYYDVDLDSVRGLQEVEDVYGYFVSLIPNMESYQLGEEEHIRKYLWVEAERALDCNLDYFLPVGNELTLHGVIEYEDQLIHISGMIDRLFINQDGEYHIHELKTGVFKENKKKKWESMRKELAFYVFLMKNCDNRLYDQQGNVIGEANFTDARVAWWGWDHTGGEGVFRGKEPVQVREMGLMYDTVSDLLRYHRNYRGDTDGLQFPLLPMDSLNYICEPWCALKGFCPRYEKALMPYNARVFKSESPTEGAESG